MYESEITESKRLSVNIPTHSFFRETPRKMLQVILTEFSKLDITIF